jgi:hypothetical protein
MSKRLTRFDSVHHQLSLLFRALSASMNHRSVPNTQRAEFVRDLVPPSPRWDQKVISRHTMTSPNDVALTWTARNANNTIALTDANLLLIDVIFTALRVAQPNGEAHRPRASSRFAWSVWFRHALVLAVSPQAFLQLEGDSITQAFRGKHAHVGHPGEHPAHEFLAPGGLHAQLDPALTALLEHLAGVPLALGDPGGGDGVLQARVHALLRFQRRKTRILLGADTVQVVGPVLDGCESRAARCSRWCRVSTRPPAMDICQMPGNGLERNPVAWKPSASSSRYRAATSSAASIGASASEGA